MTQLKTQYMDSQYQKLSKSWKRLTSDTTYYIILYTQDPMTPTLRHWHYTRIESQSGVCKWFCYFLLKSVDNLTHLPCHQISKYAQLLQHLDSQENQVKPYAIFYCIYCYIFAEFRSSITKKWKIIDILTTQSRINGG